MLFVFLILPIFIGALIWYLHESRAFTIALAVIFSALDIYCAVMVYINGFSYQMKHAAFGFDFSFLVTDVSALFILLAAVLYLPLTIYTAQYCAKDSDGGKYQFLLYLSFAMLNGALLSDHLGFMLFFWQGLLVTMFAMTLMRNHEKPQTAIKTITVAGISDLTLMFGIALTAKAAETGVMSDLSHIPLSGVGIAGCVCLLLGAIGKAGCMPLHSWRPAAADDATAPFMAAFVGVIEKIAGIYLATRIITQFYNFSTGSALSIIFMVLGAVTLIGGGLMALKQLELKKMLTWLSIAGTGFIVMSISTRQGAGVVGGVYLTATYTVCMLGLYIAAGAVEKTVGTTDLKKIGGMRHKMPATMVCTVIFALSIAGFPLTSGFFSQSLSLEAIYDVSIPLFIAALIGVLLIALTLLKLVRGVFFGEEKAPVKLKTIKKTSAALVIPQGFLAVLAIAAAVNILPVPYIEKAYEFKTAYEGFSASPVIMIILCVVLVLSVLDHMYCAKKSGSIATATDHIEYSKALSWAYTAQGKGYFDPYTWSEGFFAILSKISRKIEDGVVFIYDKAVPNSVRFIGDTLSAFDNGSLSRYLGLAICGIIAVGIVFLIILL